MINIYLGTTIIKRCHHDLEVDDLMKVLTNFPVEDHRGILQFGKSPRLKPES